MGSTTKWHGINERKQKQLEVSFNGTSKKGLDQNRKQCNSKKW
jgi:hypothetical protein